MTRLLSNFILEKTFVQGNTYETLDLYLHQVDGYEKAVSIILNRPIDIRDNFFTTQLEEWLRDQLDLIGECAQNACVGWVQLQNLCPPKKSRPNLLGPFFAGRNGATPFNVELLRVREVLVAEATASVDKG